MHHKEHLTEDNLSDPTIALDEENLVGVCFNCHCRLHKQGAIRQGLTFDEDGNLIKV